VPSGKIENLLLNTSAHWVSIKKKFFFEIRHMPEKGPGARGEKYDNKIKPDHET
jgi:hypothetical protein